MKSALIALTMMSAAVSPALAQDDGAPELVEALIVNARTPGPAWWSVSKGDAKVWVLGAGVAVPVNARWDSKAFERRIRGAARVLVVPSSTTDFQKETIRADRVWAEELTDAERARLAEVAAATRRSPGFYAAFRPNFAGILIKSELDARAKPKAGKAQDLEAKVRDLGARVVPVGGQETKGMRDSFRIGQHDDLRCLRWALRPHDPAAMRQERAQAWMRGDVRALLIGPIGYDPCVQAMSTMQAAMEGGETRMADAIAASLDGGDGAVAMVGLTALLRQGGVLDQLRRRGYVVRTPAQLDD
jgi:hypothetical protein